MKKKLFLGLLAAAAVSFTACQKDEVLNEVQQDNAIGFGTYVGRDAQTKASVTDLTALQGSNAGFGVFAYYTGSSNYANTYKPEFMNNEKVWYDGVWKYTNIKYWPENNSNHKVSFFAYAPHTDVTNTPETNITAFGTTGTNGIGDPTLTFKVASTVSEQVDLLYAEPVKDRWNGDISIQDPTYTDQTIEFTFKHALSRIGFKAAAKTNDYKITITSITLSGSNFSTTATLNLNTGIWDYSTDTEGSAEYILNPLNIVVNGTTTTKVNNESQYIMVIPTNTEATTNSVSVEVTYKYNYKVGNDNWAFAENSEPGVTESGTIDLIFVKNTAYTLLLTLEPLQPIEFSVTRIVDWNTQADTSVDTQVDTPVRQ